MQNNKTDILAIVKRTIADNNLLSADSDRPVIVGLSGGADSVVLLHILTSLGYPCIAANCNFHLRGAESDSDSAFAIGYAQSLGIECTSCDFDVHGYMASRTSISEEEACRDLRYEWFDQLRRIHDAQAIAVGHHADDNIETFLFNLQRGTGLRGLSAMTPRNDRGVIRPLIHLTRAQIEQYCADHDLSFVTDSSNLSSKYSRNRLRNEIIPAFQRLFPNFNNGVLTTMSNLANTESLYRGLIEDKRSASTHPDGSISLTELSEAEPMAPTLLYEWFKPIGLTRSQAEDIVAARHTSGKLFLTPSHTLCIDRGRLIISSNTSPDTAPSIADFSIETLPIEYYTHPSSPYTACFSTDILVPGALGVRTWRKGDRIHPLGMKGTKKISDIFSNAKIPVTLKSEIPILTFFDKPLWIVGLRQDDRLKVLSSDREFVCITYNRKLPF